MDNLSGRQFGPYQLESRIGAGGMAVVYKALQLSVNRHVAVKVLDRQLASDPEFVGRFRREVSILALLKHPAVLSIIDFGETDGYSYLVMPLVDGGTLAEQLCGEPQPLSEVQRIVSQVAAAIDYAHGKGVVHRDIKPSNILLDESGNCLVSDFGIARMNDATTHLTMTGTQIGTPAYMSPEQAEGEPGGTASDIYSLGIVLYELLTGRVPFTGNTPVAVAVKHLTAAVPPPTSLNPSLGLAMEEVVLKALAKSPAQRFSTARELVAALAEACARPAPPRPPAEPTREIALDATVVEPRQPTTASWPASRSAEDAATETVLRTGHGDATVVTAPDATVVTTHQDSSFAPLPDPQTLVRRGSRIGRAAILAIFATAVGVGLYLMTRPGASSEPETLSASETPSVPFESAACSPTATKLLENLPISLTHWSLSFHPLPPEFRESRLLLWRCLSMWPPPLAPER